MHPYTYVYGSRHVIVHDDSEHHHALTVACSAEILAYTTTGSKIALHTKAHEKQVQLLHSTPASPTCILFIKSTTLASSSSGMRGRLMTEVGT